YGTVVTASTDLRRSTSRRSRRQVCGRQFVRRGGLVATPGTVTWRRDAHTAAKHEILARYSDAWFPIMLRATVVRSLTVCEGYAGPGEYDSEASGVPGPEGSPL